MGPDCGTAVVDGLGLGFANATSPGPVGIVAASGTGCQQLLALLDHAGVGVTNALGVGGRDLSAAVGGRSTREALRRLDADPAVELIVLVSKPPADDVATEIREFAAALVTPVEIALLGPGQPDLTAAAERVLQRLGHAVPEWPVDGSRQARPPGRRARGSCSRRHALRRGELVPTGSSARPQQPPAVRRRHPARRGGADPDGEHPMVDFGADELTQGRAHPMIDPTIRLDHLSRVADDPRTGVVLLDVVLGHGAEPDPAAALAPMVRDVVAKGVPVVVSCVGTDRRPAGPGRATGGPGRGRRRGPPVQRPGHSPGPRPARGCVMTRIVSVGADLFADAIESQAAEVDRVTWRPPMEGTEADLATVATDPLRADANARALAAVLGVQAMLVDVRPASDVLGLQPGQFLHAGPPIGWDTRLRPAAGRADGRRRARGAGRRPRAGGRAVRRRRLDVRAVPPPRRGRPDGGRGRRRACGCSCSRTRPPGDVRTAP